MNKNKSDVFNVNYYDSFTVSLLKRLFKKKEKIKVDDFILNGVFYKSCNIKKGLFHYLLQYIVPGRFLLKVDIKYLKGMRNKKIDLICSHWGGEVSQLANIYSRKYGIPYIATFHGSDVHTIPNICYMYKYNVLDVLDSSFHNIFISNQLKKTANKLGYKKNNNTIINNGVSFSSIHIENKDYKDYFNIPKDKKIVGFIGNLYNVKNPQILIPLINEINKKRDDLYFIIVGDGPIYSYLDDNISKNNGMLLGRIESDEIFKVFNCIDLLLVPSFNEGFPLVIIESLAVKKTVIASRVGGIPEILNDEFTVEINDDFLLNIVEKIDKYIDLPFSQSRELVRDWRDIVKIEENIQEQCLKRIHNENI